MHWDLETLYDAHAHRLYAHCWSLLGDHGAAGAFGATLTEAVRRPPRGEPVLWLHQVARAVCAERGAFDRHGGSLFAEAADDPLLNVAGDLSGDHREALLLFEGKWLAVRDIAEVVRVPPDGVRDILREARTTLERLVLDALIRGAADPAEHMEVIAAFEAGRLPHLLARRGPARAPAALRDRVLAGPDREETAGPPAESGAAADRLVVIDSGAGPAASEREHSRRRSVLKGVGGVTGVAATVAAGLMMAWPSAGGGATAALGQQEDGSRPGPVPAGSIADEPGAEDSGGGDTGGTGPGGGEEAAPMPSPTTEKQTPVSEEPAPPSGGASGPSAAEPPRQEAPSSPPSSAAPPSAQRQAPQQEAPAQEAPSQEPPDRRPDGRWRPGSPLDPITDIVGSITSPLLGG
ncbi:hypothetical protein ACN3XK_72710 [Actinomadura welshii]